MPIGVDWHRNGFNRDSFNKDSTSEGETELSFAGMIALSSLQLKNQIRPSRSYSFSSRIYGTEPPLPQARPYVLEFSFAGCGVHSCGELAQTSPETP